MRAIIVLQGIILIHLVEKRVWKLIKPIYRLLVKRTHRIMRFLLEQVNDVLVIFAVSISRRGLVAYIFSD